MKRFFLSSFVLLNCFLFSSSPAFAIDSQLMHLNFPGSRFFSLLESKPKPMDTLTLGLDLSYAVNPLEFGNSNGNVPSGDIVGSLATFDFGASYSFSDQFALALNLPMHISGNIASLVNTTSSTNINLGDIQLMGLFNFLDREQTRSGLSVSVSPFMGFPTGDSGDFLGNSSITAGVIGVVDGEWAGHFLALNLGFRFREPEQLLNLSIGQELLYGLGYSHVLSEEAGFSGFVEVNGSTVLARAFSEEISSPVESKIGLTKSFLEDESLKVTAGGGLGFGSGYGAPDFRAAIKVAYDHFLPRAKKEVVIREVVVEKPVRIQKIEKRLEELTIYYPTDGFQVDPFYDQKIAGIAFLLKDNSDLGPLYIASHTDDVGKDGYNQGLSERRAKQALNSILKHGIDDKRVISLGVGETDHIASNDTEQNRALNRRTLFTFEKPKQLRENGEAVSPYWLKPVPVVGGKVNDSFTETLKQKEREKNVEVPPAPAKKTIIRKEQGEDTSLYDSLETEKDNSKAFKSQKKDSLKEGDLQAPAPQKKAKGTLFIDG